jgi:hypothetical protein
LHNHYLLIQCYENNVTEFEIFSEQVNYFENSKLHGSFKGVKGNLKKHIQYWKDIGANEFILGTISEGYVIPFSSNPPSMCFTNIKMNDGTPTLSRTCTCNNFDQTVE